jgi:alkylation response protein AidB-like acyl-CoA dehydrogenase
VTDLFEAGTGTATADPDLLRLIDAHAADTEAACRVVDPVAEALHAAGLYRMLVPGCLGGAEVDVLTAFDVIERISKADGSTGWSFMAGATETALAGAFLGDDAVADIFADPRAVVAGTIAPLGTATPVDDGYRIQGRYGFGSGSAQASWMMGGYRVIGPDGPVRLPSGAPRLLAGFVPKSSVEIISDWDVIGLRGTGSHDFVVPARTVDPSYTFGVFDGRPRRGGPTYRLGAYGVTCLGHSAFAVGVARRALEEIAALSLTRRRAGQGLLVDDPRFREEYARKSCAVESARAYVREIMAEFEAAARTGEVTLEQRARARGATTWAVNTASDAATFVQHAAGSTGLRHGSTIQRCFLDLQAAELHVFTDAVTYRQVGEVRLGRAAPGTFI